MQAGRPGRVGERRPVRCPRGGGAQAARGGTTTGRPERRQGPGLAQVKALWGELPGPKLRAVSAAFNVPLSGRNNK